MIVAFPISGTLELPLAFPCTVVPFPITLTGAGMATATVPFPLAGTVTGAEVAKAYAFGVVSGLPTDVELLIQPVVTNDKVVFLLKNNSGSTLTAGNILVNIYK